MIAVRGKQGLPGLRHARRAAIEEAAARLFARRGYDGVSTDDLVQAAGISRPTFYAHFPSKQELYRQLLRKHSKQMVDYMRDRVRTSTGPPANQIADVTDAFFAFVEEHPFAWRMLFREPPSDPSLSRGAKRIHDQARSNIAALLRRLRPSAHSRAERTLLLLDAEALKSAQQGLAAWWYDHPEVPRSELVATILGMCGIAGAPGRTPDSRPTRRSSRRSTSKL
jgi:AcrR family transcriptional regulator